MTGSTGVTAHRGREHSAPSRFRLPNERVLFGTLGFVGLLGAWEAASQLELVKRSLLSSPSLIVSTGIRDFGSGAIQPHIYVSLSEWLVGFGIALAFAIPVGLVLGYFRRFEALFSMLLPAYYSTPLVALIPLIILLFGIGFLEKIVVVFLATIDGVIISTMSGVLAVDQRHYDLARSFGASRGLTFRSVVLPSTLPFIMTGIRIGAGRALVGMVVAEILASNAGIGFYIILAGATIDTNRVFLGILVLGIFGVTIGEVIRRIEHHFDAWRPAIH